MKRILFLVFFSLALVAIPLTLQASTDCEQDQSATVGVNTSGSGNTNINVNVNQNQTQNCGGNTPPPVPAPTPAPPPPSPPPAPTPVPVPTPLPVDCSQEQSASVGVNTEGSGNTNINIGINQNQTQNCPPPSPVPQPPPPAPPPAPMPVPVPTPPPPPPPPAPDPCVQNFSQNISTSTDSGSTNIVITHTQTQDGCPPPPPLGICDATDEKIIIRFDAILLADNQASSTAGPFSADIPSGIYKVWLSSFDNHLDKPDQIQPNESWFAIFRSASGSHISTTTAISDLEQDREVKEELVDENLTIGQTASSIILKHAAYPSDNPNSITAKCMVLEKKSDIPTTGNNPPVWTGVDHATTTLGTLLAFSATATDPDGDELSFSTELPEGASWATSTGIFTWTPMATSTLGTTTAKFFASDGKATSTHSVVIEVFPVSMGTTTATTTPNRPPFFVNFNPPTRATSTVEYSFDADAVDPDNDPLTYCLSVSPTGMSISTSTGLIIWTPTIEQASSTPYNVSVCVTDGHSTTSESYQIQVASSTAATTTPTTPPSTPPPPSGGGSGGGGGGGGGGSSTPPPTSSSGGGGGGPPVGTFGVVNVPPSSPTPIPPPAGGTRPISPPKSDSAPLKPIGGKIIKPTSTSATTSAPEENDRFFGLGALSLLGLLKIWDWLKAHCCLISWLIWLLTVIAFLTYIYYLKRKNKSEDGMPETPTIIEEEVPPKAEFEWRDLKAQEEEDNLL